MEKCFFQVQDSPLSHRYCLLGSFLWFYRVTGPTFTSYHHLVPLCKILCTFYGFVLINIITEELLHKRLRLIALEDEDRS